MWDLWAQAHCLQCQPGHDHGVKPIAFNILLTMLIETFNLFSLNILKFDV